jgi:ABC-type phosphate/phosphonate transport system substrate-binding protein
MYDRPEVQAANDRLWALIRDGMRAAGLAAPDTLTRGTDAYWTAWTAPDLTLSQTCGFPYRTQLHDKVTLIGTPDYGVAGCAPGYYRSVMVARANDPRRTLTDFDGAPLAYNDDMSQSGWAAPLSHAAHLGITLPPRLCSGGHILSAHAVADGRADIAAIDAVTWDMITQWDPCATTLQVVGMTDPTPGLPLIAAAGTNPDTLFPIIAAAIAALPHPDRQSLRLHGLVKIPTATYLAIATP